MKKILAFFFATVVAMSMFALPQKDLSAKDAKASFEKANVENSLKAKVEKKHSEKLLVRDFVPAQVKEKKALAPVKKAAAKNSVAANEHDTVRLSFEEFQVGPDFYEDYEEWYVAVGNGSYGFRFDWYSADFEGTFTTDDMELEYSYGWYLDDWDEEVYVEYVEVEMTTSTKAVDEYTDLLTLDATILGDDDKVYVISATHKILKPKEIIEIAIEEGAMTWDVDWELATLDAKNDDMEIYMEWICYWVTNPASIYDVMDYTVKYKGEALELINMDMTVNAIKNDKGVIGYEIYMEMLSNEPIQYNVTVFAPIESTETVEIEINNLSIDASVAYDWGWIFCDGENDEWELSAGIDAYVMGFEMAEGTYKGVEEVMFYLTNKVTGDFTEQLYAEVVVTNDPEYGWVLNFESLCTDNKTYKVIMKKEVPAATDTVAIRFDKSANAAYYPWLDNDLLLANSNEQFYAGIDVVGVEMGGEFTMDNLDLSYSLIFSDYANRVMVEMADVKGTIYQVGDTTYIKAEVIGYDGVLYDVELWHCVPTPTETVQVEIVADFENKINTDGYYVLSGYSDNTLYVSLAPFAEEVAGTFVNDGVFSRFGEGQYDFYCDYSAIYKNVNGEAVPYSVEKCTMTVTEEDGLIKAVATLIAADAVQYEVTMTTTYNNHLNYDAVEGAIDRTYTADDVLLMEQYGNGISYLEVADVDGSDMFALYFFSEEYDSEIVIQPGTYTIDDTQDYMTVLASEGVVGNSIYPSFYGYLSEDGKGIITPLYFLVGGTVEVENRNGKLYVEVNAVNSYGVPVHLVYDASVPEPVEKPEPTYTENVLNTYAFGLESELTEDASVLNVTYRLNNSNATSVNVLVYEGEVVVATIAGGTSIGKNVVEVATAELPQGVELTWGVEVNGTSVEVPTQEEKIYSFYHPSGLDIDNNPENATFGLLLVNEGMHSVKDITGYVSSGFGAGIFAFTPSFDLIPNGELPGNNGGIEFTNGRYDAAGSTAYSPRRIRISEDGRIFVTSLNTDGNYLWEVDPNNFNEWTPIFKGILNEQAELITEDSAFVAAPNNGFDVKGSGENLQLAMYSVNLSGITAAAMGGFRLHEYNLGTATEWTTAPSKAIVEGKYAINYTGTQVEYDNEGGLWIASYRGSATDANPGLVHINAEGVEDCKLVWNNVRQAGIRFNNDFTKLVVAGNNGAAKKATIYSISKDENGAPVLTEETVINMAVVGNNLNDFAWDYAGNLYACGNSAEKLVGWAMPYSGTVVTPAASEYAFQVGEPVEPVEMVGVVKRTLFNGYDVVVLTHEEDGTAHIYQVVDGKAVAEVSQEGVIAVDPENAGDYLAISDIALTEDGKLVAINKIVCQAGDAQVDEGYKRGETRVYIWNDLAGAPSIWFTSKMSSNWYRSVQGQTVAYKGTSTNGTLVTTGITATGNKFRYSVYNVIDGVYTDPAVNDSEHYHYTKGSAQTTDNIGANYEINFSLLAENTWVLDGELIDPFEITDPLTYNTEVTAGATVNEDLGKKYNGATYVTVGEQVLMVAPFATPEGKLTSVEILDITAGFDAPQYVDQLFIDEAVEATAAATAVKVVEGEEANVLLITLVADATIYSLEATLAKGDNWEVYEDEISNLVIDLDNLVLIGGPSSAFQVDVYLPLGEYNMSEDSYQLTAESSIAVMGSDATFIEGYAYEIDAFAPSAKAVVRCEWNGMKLEFHLTMTAAPLEATVVVVENAVVEIEKYQIWGDMYDYALKMTGEWVNEADGLTYPVLVEVPVYYPEATEPSEIMSTVTVGGWGDNDPWLGFGEGTLTVTTENISGGSKLITATGIVQNPMAGVAIDITISGTIVSTAVEDATVTVKPVKVIKNGQLIISKDGKEYNAQGAQL